MTNRLFIALEINDYTKNNIIEIRNTIFDSDEPVKWENKSKYHITLKFLGDVDTIQIPKISQILKLISENTSPIKIKFNKFGIFKKNNNPKILWLGIENNLNLINLVKNINEKFNKIGFTKDFRKFKAHLTILRIKRFVDQNKINSFLDYPVNNIFFMSDSILLVKSDLKKKGSAYKILEKYKLS